MKIRTMILSCLLGAVVLSMGHQYCRAGSEADKPCLKIGVVSVQKVFEGCKRSARYNAEALSERDRAIAELENLSKKIDADKAGLKRFKAGSSDHLAELKEIYEKQGKYDSTEKYHIQQKATKYQRFVETLFVDILRETGEVAKEKGLDMVIEKDEVEFPALSVDSAMLAIRTHKLLYSGGCQDITNEVMARIDAMEKEK
ncbi:MAG: OmpH/Skp family outer membrane protein [Planctomycetota bacterium]